jgi:mannobiose 2-epimerase
MVYSSAMTSIRWFLVIFLAGWAAAAQADSRTIAAAKFKTQLQQQVLPYWYDTALDKTNGGYLLSDNADKTASPATVKQLVTQARMIWGFSHAYNKGFRDPQRDYLAAARLGYEFLMKHFYDATNGGYYWETDLKGKPINTRKILYGESFVIYALVEYHRATEQYTPLRQAMDLYGVIQKRAHDPGNGGWVEHFEKDWKPILTDDPSVQVEVGGLKSANTHLHLMEALAELYQATADEKVGQSLQEALKINMTHFYPLDPGKSCFHKQQDWKPATGGRSAGLSYGHNVEFAWLMIRAQQVLREDFSWDHFYAHLNHALKYGFDEKRGGLYSRGMDDKPATDRDKIWWVQAEMLAALTDALAHDSKRAYSKALKQEYDFIFKYQVEPKTGIWYDTVTEDGKPKNPTLAHNWKANYHDVRGMIKFIEAFEKE